MTTQPPLHKTNGLWRTIRSYRREFWILFGATLINATGSAFIIPFLTLYMRQRFDISMTLVGGILAAMAAVGVVSGLLVGILADRFGRKNLVVYGLGLAALVSLGMGLAVSPLMLAVLAVIYSFLYPTFGPNSPALQAMVADLTTPEQRAHAYSLMRLVANLGIAIGPAIAGFLSQSSYFLLFSIDAVTSLLFALCLFLFIGETKPELSPGEQPTRRFGYGLLLQDKPFLLLFICAVLVALVYVQMNSTLPVFVKEQQGLSAGDYGLMMSLNALLVVLLQLPVTRFTTRYAQTSMLALGAALFGIGFGLTALVTNLPLFALSVAIWTLGEMVYAPLLQAYAANNAPVDMRARYLGVIGLSWTIGLGMGPFLAGLLMDFSNAYFVWYGCAIIGVLMALVFLGMGQWQRRHMPLRASVQK